MDGILLSICHDQVNLNEYRRIIRKGIPIVLFDRTIAEMDASQIKIDDYIKSFFMVEHLIRKGKTKIIHLTGPSYIQNTFERIKGYKDALSKFNIPFKVEYLVEAGVDFNRGENAVRMLVEKKYSFRCHLLFYRNVCTGSQELPSGYRNQDTSGCVHCLYVEDKIKQVGLPHHNSGRTARGING